MEYAFAFDNSGEVCPPPWAYLRSIAFTLPEEDFCVLLKIREKVDKLWGELKPGMCFTMTNSDRSFLFSVKKINKPSRMLYCVRHFNENCFEEHDLVIVRDISSAKFYADETL